MTIAFAPRSDANRLKIEKEQTLEEFLQEKSLAGKLNEVALYNWGTIEPAEINRALVELVGCKKVEARPLESVLDPARGPKGSIYRPEPWKTTLAADKTHTIKLKQRKAATAVAITELTPFFDPATQSCTIKCRLEGDAARATKRDWEIHAASFPEPKTGKRATSYYELKAGADRPCGTDDVDDVSHTHLVNKTGAKTPGDETITWDGTASEATQGVLKNGAKINSRCAPYSVLVRFYKDNTDRGARIKLDPFYPRWRLTDKNRRELDEGSLVVRWALEGGAGSLAKLKQGQIAIHDKTGDVAFVAPLSKDQIASGSYDLLKGPVKWDKTQVDRAKLPYRVQIQAHSDWEEENGLALAVMPTQVPAFAYDKVQLIGFNVRNDTRGLTYLGDADADTDIDTRCAVLVEAIQKAKAGADTDRSILKLFVAPEFYFRGKEGAYPAEKISTIVPKLRAETDKAGYLDWLFVFGTAIGYEKHETAAGGEISHGEAIHGLKITGVQASTKTINAKAWTPPKKGWVFRQGGTTTEIAEDAVAGVKDPADASTSFTFKVSNAAGLAAGDAEMIEPVMAIAGTSPFFGPKTQIKVPSKLCGRIPVDGAKKVLQVGPGKWQVRSGGITKTITEVDFRESEGFYWLTLESGGAFKKGSPLTLLEPKATEVMNVALIQKGWSAPHLGTGSLRELVVYKENVSHIDFIRVNDKTPWKDSKERLIEVHGEDRAVLPTDGSKDLLGASPNVKRRSRGAVGSEINLSGLGGGSVFTVDEVTFGLEVCLDHGEARLWEFYNGASKQARAGDPKIQVQLIPSWGMSIGGTKVGKEVVAPAPTGLVFNVDGARMESVARVFDGTTYSCDDHVTKTGAKGDKCDEDKSELNAGDVKYLCDTCNPGHYVPKCTDVSHDNKCGNRLRLLGAVLTATSTTDVPSSNKPAYFKKKGNVQVFPAKALPPADVVK